MVLNQNCLERNLLKWKLVYLSKYDQFYTHSLMIWVLAYLSRFNFLHGEFK